MAISAKGSARITTQLKKYQSVLSNLQKRDVSEADTVTVINDMLSDNRLETLSVDDFAAKHLLEEVQAELRKIGTG